MVRPTKVASNNAADAKMIVPQRLPDSPRIVENSAAPKASISPTMANRNRTHICESASCGKRGAIEGCRLGWVRSGINAFSYAGRCS